MRIGKIASCVEYQIDEHFQNFLSFVILIVFQISIILKNFQCFKFLNSENLLILQFVKFQKLPISKIPKNSNLENSPIFKLL